MGGLRCSLLRPILTFALIAFLPAGCAIVPLPTRSLRAGESDAPGSCADCFACMDQRAVEAHLLGAGSLPPLIFKVPELTSLSELMTVALESRT